MPDPHVITGKVVARFAPSPTGYLHIGGARTALFNWAFARRHRGTFILRIEDTDAARSTAESTRRIIEDLQWLGLDWDEGPDPAAADVYALDGQRGARGPYFQSQRGVLYHQFLEQLRLAGRAYRCFKSQEQLKAERDAARAAKRPEKYDPTEALRRSETEQQRLIAEGKPFVWRFRMPDTDITVNDLVLGDVTIKRAELEDFIIMKSERPGRGSEGVAGGGPTFHFANVVDDATMEVTHVLRAQEHLMNTPKHVAMFDALGLARPHYAHVPLIFNPDSTKMSKREKAKVVRAAMAKGAAAAAGGPLDLPALAARAASDAVVSLGVPPGPLREAVLHHLGAVLEFSDDDSMRAKVRMAGGPSPQEQPGLQHAFLAAFNNFLAKKNDSTAIAHILAAELRVALPEFDVHDFRMSGYLKDVLLNYVSLLGWSPPSRGGENVERFDLEYLKTHFAVEGIGKSNAKFDRAKLLAFNADTLAKMPSEQFFALWKDYVLFRAGRGDQAAKDLLARFDDARLHQLAAAYQVRARTLQDPLIAGRFFVVADDQIEIDPAAVKKVLEKNEGAGYAALREVRDALPSADPWQAATLHKTVEDLATRTARPIGDIAQPIRVAVSGSTVSPPIDQTLEILGKAATLARIDRALRLQSATPPSRAL